MQRIIQQATNTARQSMAGPTRNKWYATGLPGPKRAGGGGAGGGAGGAAGGGSRAVVLVSGLGCGRSTSEEVRRETMHGLPLYQVCNRSEAAIVSRLVLGKLAPFRTPMVGFVSRVHRLVKQLLQRYSKVYLLGHSFGGGVVTKVAASLRSSRVKAATFGSVYTRNVPGITHYMRTDDIVRRYNFLSPSRHKYIRWIPSNGPLSWAAHNNYREHMVRFVTST